MKRSAVAPALAVTLAGLVVSVALALLLVPLLSPIVASTPLWRGSMLVAAALAAPALGLFCLHALRPVRVAGAPTSERRRAAHEFPFRVARLWVIAAMSAGVATGAGLWVAHPDERAASLAAGVVTWLVWVMPALGVYLGSRQVLHGAAAGDEPVGGVRQSVRLRLMLAFQFPVLVSMAGLVLVEQSNDVAYHHTLTQFYQQQYAQALSRVFLTLSGEEERATALRELRPPAGVEARSWTDPDTGDMRFGLVVEPQAERSVSARLLPFALLLGVTVLAALLGRWLARELTGEMRTVEAALRTLRTGGEASTAVPTGAFALRETQRLVAALNDALATFRDRDRVVREAAEARRRAEHAKSRFLAHLSHELKSPLNSILGFSEVLLAGLDGDLTPEQRAQLAIVWRSGDMLLRYILALLDLARLEAAHGEGVHDVRRLGFEPAPLSAAELEQTIRRQWRTDPLRVLGLDLRNEVPAPDEPAYLADPARTARAIVLGAGMLLDAVERGVVRIVCSAEDAALVIDVALAEAEADDGDRRQLVDQLEALGASDRPVHIGAAATVVTLLRQVTTAQGGSLDIQLDRWPRLRFRLPRRLPGETPLPRAAVNH